MEINPHPKTILLLEDDKALNRAVMFKMQQKGHHIISTMRAEDALELLRTEHPSVDIIWLDILLPKMSGLQFLVELRKNPEYKNTKVVVCSVSEGEISKGFTPGLGVSDYLVKSEYEIDTLTDKVLSYA